MGSDHVNTIIIIYTGILLSCEHIVSWISSTTKSVQIDIQQILIKPHYILWYFYVIFDFVHFALQREMYMFVDLFDVYL